MAEVQTSSTMQSMCNSHCLQNSADHEAVALHHPLMRSTHEGSCHLALPPFPHHKVHKVQKNYLSLPFSSFFFQPLTALRVQTISAIFLNLEHHRNIIRKLAYEAEQNTAFILCSPSMVESSLASQFIIKTILQQHLQGIT